MSYNKNEPESIQAMFATIASQYDFANSVLSLQMHKRWNAALIKAVMKNHIPTSFLDLCCGTGEIAFTYLTQTKNSCPTYMVDFCKEMLQCAQKKASTLELDKKHSITYIQADVQTLPLGDQIASCATMAYGIRNVKNPSESIAEVFRVLKPGGRFGILELTRPTNPLLRLGHSIYLRACLPILGKLIASNKEAYQYLCKSISGFIEPAELEKLLLQQGFAKVERKPLLGGVATILLATK